MTHDESTPSACPFAGASRVTRRRHHFVGQWIFINFPTGAKVLSFGGCLLYTVIPPPRAPDVESLLSVSGDHQTSRRNTPACCPSVTALNRFEKLPFTSLRVSFHRNGRPRKSIDVPTDAGECNERLHPFVPRDGVATLVKKKMVIGTFGSELSSSLVPSTSRCSFREGENFPPPYTRSDTSRSFRPPCPRLRGSVARQARRGRGP